MNKLISLLLFLWVLPPFGIAQKIGGVANESVPEHGNKAEPGQVIRIQLEYEKPGLKEGPFELYFDGNALKLQSFTCDSVNEKRQAVFFFLDRQKLAASTAYSQPENQIKLDIGDKSGNLTHVEKVNFNLILPEYALGLQQDKWQLNQLVGLRVKSLQQFAQLPQKKEDIHLYVEDILQKSAVCTSVTQDVDSACLFFSVNKTEFAQQFYQNESTRKLRFGIGTEQKQLFRAKEALTTEFLPPYGKLVFWLVFLLIGWIIVSLCRKTDMIKDPAPEGIRKTYSLSRTQFAFWTFLTINALVYILFTTKALVDLPPEIFILLGISAALTAASQLAENTPGSMPAQKMCPEIKSGFLQFFTDLLSDGGSVSVHRLQNLLFTVFFGIYFWMQVINHLAIPVMNNNLLILMGVSGAAYAVQKGMTNGVLK